MTERVTHDAEGMLDEIVARGVDFHLERMWGDSVYFSCNKPGVQVLSGFICVERRWFRRPRLRVRISETTLPRRDA